MNNRNEIHKKMGAYFRVRRKELKMSVRILSELTGIHPGAIIKFELGKTDMTVSRFFLIAQILRINSSDLALLMQINVGESW